MLLKTVPRLRCPICLSRSGRSSPLGPGPGAKDGPEIRYGTLVCRQCKAGFPIVAGVAILVEDVHGYFLEHAKGISRLVPQEEIPEWLRTDFLEAAAEAGEIQEHIEEDLEAERVTSLYMMNHYLGAKDFGSAWWKPESGESNPQMDELIRRFWDRGPMTRIADWSVEWSAGLDRKSPGASAIELGCGVGGLALRLAGSLPGSSYLGIDSSFASIALGRHLLLGAPYRGRLGMPGDLLFGPVSREISRSDLEALREAGNLSETGQADLIVGDLENPPVARGEFDLSIALNAIDMMASPENLPRIQAGLLREGGVAYQSCPYIWHEQVSRSLRDSIPGEIRDSALAVEWLYTDAGFSIDKRDENLTWLFFKHFRQLEIYSVHAFQASIRT